MIPAIITAHPSQPSQPSTSSARKTPASAANGASSVKTSAARAAVVRPWTQVAMRYPSAPANTPVTMSAPQTVAPRGTSSWPSASAMTLKPTNDVAIMSSVSARGS